MTRFGRNDVLLAIGIVLACAFLVSYVRRPPCRGEALVERDVDRVTHAVTIRIIPARTNERGCRVPFFGQ
jgi:hypothetical protein